MKKSLIIVFLSAILLISAVPVMAQEDQGQSSKATSQKPGKVNPIDDNNPQPTIVPQTSPQPTPVDTAQEGSEQDVIPPQATGSAKPVPKPKVIIQSTDLELPTDVPPQPVSLVQVTPVPQEKTQQTTKLKTIVPLFYDNADPATSNIYASSKLSPFVSHALLGLAGFLFIVGIVLMYIEKFSKFLNLNKATDMRENIFIRLS
jgi:hypothetical protein